MMQFTNENILGPMQTSLFSGLYRILKVKNQFRSGQFTQELELIRLPRQDKLDYADNKPPTSDERGNQVPGEKAILDNNTLGPDFNTPDSAKSSTAESDDTAQSAQQQQADNRTDESDRTKEEQELVETRALAPEEPISGTTEPVTVPYPSADNKINSAKVELKTSIETRNTASAGRDTADANFAAINQEFNSASDPTAWAQNPANRARYESARLEADAADAAYKKAQSQVAAGFSKVDILQQAGK
jgi:hypothetical protein